LLSRNTEQHFDTLRFGNSRTRIPETIEHQIGETPDDNTR
jgi:hypothetical protein